jgi:hypothetical protein
MAAHLVVSRVVLISTELVSRKVKLMTLIHQIKMPGFHYACNSEQTISDDSLSPMCAKMFGDDAYVPTTVEELTPSATAGVGCLNGVNSVAEFGDDQSESEVFGTSNCSAHADTV